MVNTTFDINILKINWNKITPQYLTYTSMWQLKKIAVGVGLIILLELLKKFLQFKQHDAPYFYFFTNLLSCYQLLILLYCIISLALEELILKRFFKHKYKILGAAFFVALFLVCELVAAYFLFQPKSISKGLRLYQRYYREIDMNVIQFKKESSEYNKKLFYKLKDNTEFVYRNREFSNSFQTNSQGFRDDEASLKQPSIIFLGDSYTLGWGVEENETYGSVVEHLTGLKGLNTGASSYGTARQSMVLSSLDTSNVEFIIWQYCYNDAVENKTYTDSSFNLPIRTENEFNKLVKFYGWNAAYFPGKYFLTILNLSRKNLVKKPVNIAAEKVKLNVMAQKEAEMFMNILAKSNINWNRTKVIVIELNYWERHSEFINALQKLCNENPVKEKLMGNLYPIDIKAILRKEDYYILDVHLTKQGNFKVGEHLAKTIQKLQTK